VSPEAAGALQWPRELLAVWPGGSWGEAGHVSPPGGRASNKFLLQAVQVQVALHTLDVTANTDQDECVKMCAKRCLLLYAD